MFERAYTASFIDEFKQRVLDNIFRLERENGISEFATPIAVFLILDQANGGNNTGEELIRRFNFIDQESRDVIDFFFIGWNRKLDSQDLVFDLRAFEAFREALQRVGVSGFGGYADMLLFDAWLRDGRVALDFEHALHVDLAEALATERIVNVGGFIQSLVEAAAKIRADASLDSSAVIRISDRLGLATAKRSVLQYVLEKWGKIIGANSLVPLATRRVGPTVDLAAI